ncbi:MAG: amidohydrolase family protein [Proteobacteria bacterium]|nr:amidohydrolase family protein [Pseudomonadota bacterium]
MPKTSSIDLSVRPLPKEIAVRYAALSEYRHVWEEMFKRPEVLRDGLPLSEMAAEMDRWNVNHAVVSGYDARNTNGLYVENDWVAGPLSQTLPNRIIQGIGIDPTRDVMENLAEIDRCVAEHNPKLVRLFPYAADLAPDHRRYYPIYAKCVEHGLAIWTQVGHTAGLMPSDPGRPIHLDRIALDFPKLRIIGGHIGWPWTEEMIAMAVKHPHVYIATCAHAPDHWPDALVPFMKTRGKRKVLFATNWPYLSYDRYFRKFGELGLSEEVERLFLRDNAIAVLRLGDDF